MDIDIKEKIQRLAQDTEERVIRLRRELHQYPELAFKEKKTAQLISEELQRCGVEVHSNYADTTAVIGVIIGDKPGPTRALRADIDALSINEDTGLPFSSKIKGQMHACGHDVHTAILLGVANLLFQLKSDLLGKIVLIFQPAEEGSAGAKVLIDQGLIEEFGIEMIFGHHVWPDLPLGVFGIRSGILTSQSDRVIIEINGKGAHAAKPDKSIDPIVIASHLILAYQELIAKEISPLDYVAFGFGNIRAGDAYNAIPEKAILKGTVRTFNTRTQGYIEKRIKGILDGITSTFRATGKLSYRHLYPSVVNHLSLTLEVTEWAKEIWGERNIIKLSKPLMIAEDFAFYSQKIPCFFGLLGIGGEHDIHNPHFVPDESILIQAVIWSTYLALKSSEVD
ncbi:amidohydrolase [Candidatus Atribacteria bacterium HGW-Atribacteria-1]|nr:MAG: amidohydrolase [Candidatus Atribacteria bacterium HGW-Atribacteria-1]